MSLINHVRIVRRFLRAVRIDTDLENPESLVGFVCPRSSVEVLLSMARHISETRQSAFTWTGPYGSGKSSLVIALSTLLCGNKKLREQAALAIGRGVAQEIWKKLPPNSKGWRILGVVGRRDDPVQVIGKAVNDSGYITKSKNFWKGDQLVKTLVDISQTNPRSHGGLILFIDEMGKFLETAAQGEGDIYVFQQLAEAAARSGGRFVVVGILHQAFEEYANRISREFRDEWSKIQGRFIDLAINTAGEEQIEMIARAIESSGKSTQHNKLAKIVGQHIHERKSGVSLQITDTLIQCWPLHPVTAALLGPISRRRFGQNQRSIFSFLNSSEHHGFQDFLRNANKDDLYEPARLWDYLRTNLEPSILASSDGRRWALAAEAIERCEVLDGDQLHIQLLKSIALIDLFKDRSGIIPSDNLLQACVPRHNRNKIQKALDQLKNWSLVIFRKHLGAYAIYAGSDFDIENAIEAVLENHKEIDFLALRKLAALQPILAKRHYHEYGALRWFDVDIASLDRISEYAAAFKPDIGTIGQFLLAIPTANESIELSKKLCRDAARQSSEWDIVVGLSHQSWLIPKYIRELFALERVRNERLELRGDEVARREVCARIEIVQLQLETEIHRAFDLAEWFHKHNVPKPLIQKELNSLASDLADRRFHKTPLLRNELLNRIKPSNNAIAAQNILLRRMVNKEGEPRLGIDGFPAERGLFASILEETGLYIETNDGWRFNIPGTKGKDSARLAPLWDMTVKYLGERSDRPVALTEIYDLWGAPPYGIKDGMMPILAIAFILSNRSVVACYRQAIFQARFKDLDVDYLTKNPADIQLRWMNLSDVSMRLLTGMADIIRDFDRCNTLKQLDPIHIGRALIAIYDALHPWTQRTMRLSANSIHIRGIFKKASDPNQLLFNDLPSIFGVDHDMTKNGGLSIVINNVREGLKEMLESYPAMLRQFAANMLAELQVPNDSSQALEDLRKRAENIRQLTGDFRFEAFVSRIARFTFSDENIEGLVSLATNKPPRDWVDRDLDSAAIEITQLSQYFNKMETFARVKGRPDKRHAMAVVVGLGGRPTPYLQEFNITDSDRVSVERMIKRIGTALASGVQERRNVILAALAELSIRYMEENKS